MTKGMVMKNLNLNRCRKAMHRIYVRGSCGSEGRRKLIETAISMIQSDGRTAFASEYIGMKNYAGFGDQEVNYSYWAGPRHGSVVFQIGRANLGRDLPVLGDDEIYFLMACRDYDEDGGSLSSLLGEYFSLEERSAAKLGEVYGLVVKGDGGAWCAHAPDFINLQESRAEFGDTPADAIKAFISEDSVRPALEAV